MPKGVKGQNTVNVQAWLNWNYDIESQALIIIEDMKERGYTTRQIVTDAIIKAYDDGRVPEFYEQSGTVGDRLRRIEEKIERNHDALINQFMDMMQLIKSNPVARRAMVDHMNSDQPEIDEEVRANLIDTFNRAVRGE